MRDLLISTLTALPALLFVVDPMSAAPIFLSLTTGQERAARAAIALRAVLAAGLVLSLFAILGPGLFRFFGITMPSFQIAGGLLLVRIGALMMTPRPAGPRGDRTAAAAPSDPSISPLAVPLLAGPGAITTVLVLTSREHSSMSLLAVVAAVAIVMLATWAILRGAHEIEARLSQRTTDLISPIIGLLLAAIGIEFVVSGWRAAAGASP